MLTTVLAFAAALQTQLAPLEPVTEEQEPGELMGWTVEPPAPVEGEVYGAVSRQAASETSRRKSQGVREISFVLGSCDGV